MHSFDFQPPHGEGSSSQTIRLDEDQLRTIMKQVIVGILSSRFNGLSRQEPPSTQAELSTDRSLEPHVSTLNQMMIDLRHEIFNIRFLVSNQYWRFADIEAETKPLQQFVKNDVSTFANNAERISKKILELLRKVRKDSKHLTESLTTSASIMVDMIAHFTWELRAGQTQQPGPFNPPRTAQRIGARKSTIHDARSASKPSSSSSSFASSSQEFLPSSTFQLYRTEDLSPFAVFTFWILL